MDDGAALPRRRSLAGRHDRLARHSAALLPRRRHRPAGGRGHGERPGDDGRDRGAGADLRGDPRGRLSRVPTWSASSSRCRRACDEAGAAIVTGDTKVMGRGELDGIVLNTTGVAADRPRCARRRPARRRSHPRHRHHRRPRPGGPGRAPRSGARGRAALRRRAAQRPDPRRRWRPAATPSSR